jgi:hypothetical protein
LLGYADKAVAEHCLWRLEPLFDCELRSLLLIELCRQALEMRYAVLDVIDSFCAECR